MNALRALRGGKRPENPAAWLMTIVGNCCSDHHRAAARRPVTPLLEEADAGPAGADGDPHVRTMQRAQVAGAVAAVRALPETQREALVGYELRGQSYEELADEHGWSVPATKSLLWRARTTLAAERDRWAAALGTPLVGLAHGLRALVDKPVAMLGAHQGGEAATYAVVAVVAAGAAGGVATQADKPSDRADVSATAAEVREMPEPAAGTTGTTAERRALRAARTSPAAPAPASGAPAATPAADGPQSAEDVLRACAQGEPLAGADRRALVEARSGVPADLEQYTTCEADIRRALTSG